AGVVLQRLEEALLRLGGRDLLEARHRHEPASGAGRLVLPNRHLYTFPNRPSSLPSLRVTMAFFQRDVCPSGPRPPRRRFLPRTLTVFTDATFTPCASYCSSRARAISGLVASVATRKVYRPAWCSEYERSVITGPNTTSMGDLLTV